MIDDPKWTEEERREERNETAFILFGAAIAAIVVALFAVFGWPLP